MGRSVSLRENIKHLIKKAFSTSNPTYKFYAEPNEIVICIRGQTVRLKRRANYNHTYKLMQTFEWWILKTMVKPLEWLQSAETHHKWTIEQFESRIRDVRQVYLYSGQLCAETTMARCMDVNFRRRVFYRKRSCMKHVETWRKKCGETNDACDR